MEEVAFTLNVTREAVRVIERRAVAKLRALGIELPALREAWDVDERQLVRRKVW